MPRHQSRVRRADPSSSPPYHYHTIAYLTRLRFRKSVLPCLPISLGEQNRGPEEPPRVQVFREFPPILVVMLRFLYKLSPVRSKVPVSSIAHVRASSLTRRAPHMLFARCNKASRTEVWFVKFIRPIRLSYSHEPE